MIKANGMNGDGALTSVLFSVTEIVLANSLKCWVYQLSQSDYRKLIQEWRDANPELDKKQYERPVPEDEATIPGQTLSAESNPAYQDAMRARLQMLSDYLVRAYILGYTDFPDNDEVDLIARFERVIKGKRKVMALPDDAWEATLFHAILQTDEEKQQIVHAVEKKLAVEMDGIIDQVAIFRPIDPRDSNQRVPQEAAAQSAVAEAGVQQD